MQEKDGRTWHQDALLLRPVQNMVAHLDTMGRKVEKREGYRQQKRMGFLTSAPLLPEMGILRQTHASHTPFKSPAKTGECHLKRDQVYD